MTLHDGFDGPDFAPAGGLYYRDNFEQSAGTVEFQKDVKLHGDGALKLSVKPLCPAERRGCSERAEIWEKTELRVPYDQGVWYGFAVKFADPIPADDHRYLIAQWKREIVPGARGRFQPVPGAAGTQRQTVRHGRDQLHRAEPVNAANGAGLHRSGSAGLVQARRPTRCARWSQPTRPGRSRQRTLSRLHEGDRGDRPRQQAAIAVVGLDRLRSLHQAGAGRHGPHRDFRQRQTHRHDQGAYWPCRQGPRQRTSISSSVPTGPAMQTDWTMYYDDFRRSPRCADVMGESQCPISMNLHDCHSARGLAQALSAGRSKVSTAAETI